MKTLFFILMLSFSAAAQQTDSVYCIQILSTKNPHLVKWEQLQMCTLDVPHVEKVGKQYRILIPYETYEEAWYMLDTWKRSHKTAFLTTRSKEYFEKNIRKFEPTK
jgi:ABC-type antimicrobial peptide transport system ATPase subunit